MGLFEKIFRRPKAKANDRLFETLTAYAPVFTNWGGKLYESELVRSAINARATQASKLQPQFGGEAKSDLVKKLKSRPNSWQTWSQFFYRLSTILDMQNTAFIVPVENKFMTINGIYSILPSMCEIVESNNGEPWLRYQFNTGEYAAIEMSKCGIMTKFQYDDDFFGASNNALNPTMELINIQNQAINEAVKNSATFRFMARVTNFIADKDIGKESKRFTQEVMKDGNGFLLVPKGYEDLQQIKSTPYVVDDAQMKTIKQNVFNYYGINEEIIQNKAYGDAWAAFYEGAIEPFAIQFSDVVTNMLFTEQEQESGSFLMATANRLQYMSNADKLAVSSEMADRGIMNRDEIREIWNLPPLPDGKGQAYTIRGEYYFLDEKNKKQKEAENGDD